MSKVKKIIFIMILLSMTVLQTKIYADTQDVDEINNPIIELTSCEAHPGDTVEIKLNIKYKELITAGGVTISFNNQLQDFECISSNNYIIFSDVEQQNGRVVITFSKADNIDNYNGSLEVCTLKFKIPRKLKQEETNIKIEKIEDLYSDNEFVGKYIFKDSKIKIVKPDYNQLAIIFIIAIVIILIIGIALIQNRKEKKKKIINIKKYI